jgi:16S rRNA processing protein RimM
MERVPAAGGSGTDPFLLVGRIRKPHGIRGELFVWLETDRPEAVFRPGRTLWLGDDAGPAGASTITVERSRPFKEGYLFKPREFGTRDDALEALRGRSLFIRRSETVPLAEDEVFYHELIGLRVVVAGEAIGSVREVYETGGADLLAVQREGKPELLIPFVREVLTRIDVAEGVLEIEPPPGLLEL